MHEPVPIVHLLRSFFALALLSSALAWRTADYGEYVMIGPQQYRREITPWPPAQQRYAAGVGLLAAVPGAAALGVLRRVWHGRTPLDYLPLAVTFTAVLFVVLDTKSYLSGHGPNGEDLVYSTAADGVFLCPLIGGVFALPALLPFWLISGPPGTGGPKAVQGK